MNETMVILVTSGEHDELIDGYSNLLKTIEGVTTFIHAINRGKAQIAFTTEL
jgi:hypothetical protein